MVYKWKPTFHGSLAKPKDESKITIIQPEKPLPQVAAHKPVSTNPCGEVYVLKEECTAYPFEPIVVETLGGEKHLVGKVGKEKSVAQTATSKTKAKTKKKTAAPKKKAAPAIFQWTMESSQNVGGQKAVYSTLLRSNGDLTCNCPGWIFKRGNDGRFCKHTKMVEVEAQKLYKDHKAGVELPAMELVGAGNIVTVANPKKDGDLKYGRRIILD